MKVNSELGKKALASRAGAGVEPTEERKKAQT